MSEKKVVRRRVVIALGLICILLVVGMGGAVAYYTNVINDKNAAYGSLQSEYDYYKETHNYTNSDYAYAKMAYDDYKTTHSHLDSKYDSLVAPDLVKVNLVGADNRPLLGTPYLYLSGYVCNVGTNTAYNSTVHVVAYQSGGVVAIDTYISLGTILGSGWTSVSSNVYYSGGALISWTLTLNWNWTPIP